MDQKTANLIELIKTLTIAFVGGGALVSIVALAIIHDGDYAKIIVEQFPLIIFGCLGTLGVLHLGEIVGMTLQTKWTSAPATLSSATSHNAGHPPIDTDSNGDAGVPTSQEPSAPSAPSESPLSASGAPLPAVPPAGS